MAKYELLRTYRTSAEVANVPSDQVAFLPSPWDDRLCVACGHPHHFMNRHHRLPRRVAWKIPEAVWSRIIDPAHRIVRMCVPCHNFIERRKGQPCGQRINKKYAVLPWDQLMREIDLFERIAYQRTEDLIRLMNDIAE